MKPKVQGVYVIIDTKIQTFFPILELTARLVAGGVDVIQFRHKKEYTREVFALIHDMSHLCRQHSIPLIINDRCDIALAVQAAGVHLGQTDIPIKTARKLLGPDMIIGATAGSVVQAILAEQEGADYLGFGHIFPTESKLKPYPPLGLQPLAEACNSVKIPVIAIGGINKTNLQSVCTTGIQGVAVISAICANQNPQLESEEFKTLLKHYGH